ncbi:8-amino-7-oxononanoate synthase [Paludifilum halophilum]|uniref:8-amino-7-ketopelargonate synthase n=1 Tax=Paludifilum halophilum TaxID=1642702 RepID=A0A235B3N9_9BACL|nr:8-amino-7-oxononanoate synthase [Paludifilum halophilum]OYD06910.1 8-amino-7-oxononanoate synthase [Paludifilum halophilum]
MSGSAWDRSLREQLETWDREDRLRKLQATEGAQVPVVQRGGKRLLNCSSNNYLGLADHPRIKEAARQSCLSGNGSTASRLIVGHDSRIEALEAKVAAWKGTESALLLGSGYMANIGVLSALLQRGDAVFSDRYNHASIIDGIRLSRAESYRYRHRDMDHLESGLKKSLRKNHRRRMIVTDTVFSMDGDTAPMRELVRLKERYGAALIVDEAHGTGVYGHRGEGYAADAGVAEQVDLHVGTFSKAFGAYGAYVAGRRDWIRYLVNACRPFIYTTALPPTVVGAVDAALDIVSRSDDRRRALKAKGDRFRRELRRMGLDTADSTTPIIPVITGDNTRTLAFSRALEDQGVLAVAIRPPTVPEGTGRLRFSLMANHRDEDLEQALSVIEQTAEETGVKPNGQ